MKIVEIAVSVIEQPLARPFWTAHAPITHVREVVVEISTDEGVRGIGEAKYGAPHRSGKVVLEGFKPLLVGRNPLESETLWRSMFALTWDPVARRNGWSQADILNALAAVDIALWDLKGKAAGMPVFRLLGGENRPQPFYATLGYYFDDMSLTRQADRLAALVAGYGLDAVKTKVGRAVDEDVRRVATARAALGDNIALMADANLGYSVEDAISAGRAFREHDLFWYEEPVHWYDRYRGTGRVADAVGIPIHAGESEMTRYQCRDLVLDGRVAYMSFDSTVAGGVTEWLKVAAFCETNNVLMAPHCEPQVHGHLMAAVPNPSLLEVHPDPERHPLWDHGYLDRAEIRGNRLVLQETPGFGVKFAPEYLKKWATRLD